MSARHGTPAYLWKAVLVEKNDTSPRVAGKIKKNDTASRASAAAEARRTVHIEQLVASAPQLSPDQIVRLSQLLRAGVSA